jgi:acetyl esterase/lipase
MIASMARSGCWCLVVMSILCLAGPARATAQDRVEKNVIYGMYSGLALLMDVHRPATPNGLGVVFVPGSAWTAPLAYSATPLKETQIPDWGPTLTRAGYTVFVINHRATPRFAHPAPVEDVQRAIRFVRHHGKRFGVDPARLGIIGGSSGGHLAGLATMLAAPGIAGDPDPVNREPATIQCAVLRAAPLDLRTTIGASTLATAAVVALLERLPSPNADDQKAFELASPIAYVSATSAPTLLLHGDADDTVPYQQSVAMEAALRGKGVPVKLFRIPGGAHGSTFSTSATPHPQMPEVLRETIAWLDRYLKAR